MISEHPERFPLFVVSYVVLYLVTFMIVGSQKSSHFLNKLKHYSWEVSSKGLTPGIVANNLLKNFTQDKHYFLTLFGSGWTQTL